MLVLTRKTDETIRIGDNIVITLLFSACGRAKIGIAAPREIPVVRGELDPLHPPIKPIEPPREDVLPQMPETDRKQETAA
jgi:carbon storage regulator CsrA